MAANDTIRMFRGEDVVKPFRMSPAEDITGWTIELTVAGPKADLFERAASVTSAEEGEFEFAIAKADTLGADPVAHAYAVRRTDPGEERVIAAGVFIIESAVGEPAS